MSFSIPADTNSSISFTLCCDPFFFSEEPETNCSEGLRNRLTELFNKKVIKKTTSLEGYREEGKTYSFVTASLSRKGKPVVIHQEGEIGYFFPRGWEMVRIKKKDRGEYNICQREIFVTIDLIGRGSENFFCVRPPQEEFYQLFFYQKNLSWRDPIVSSPSKKQVRKELPSGGLFAKGVAKSTSARPAGPNPELPSESLDFFSPNKEGDFPDHFDPEAVLREWQEEDSADPFPDFGGLPPLSPSFFRDDDELSAQPPL